MNAYAEQLQVRARVADFVSLTKPGITFTVVLTSAVGYWMGVGAEIDPVLLAHVLIGTALSSSGACALNMVMERKGDARMRRTRLRPLPAGRILPRDALLFGLAMAFAGVAWLTWGVGLSAGAIALFVVLGYLFAYTPLKPVSALSTWVGIPVGAAPPLIGWVAARGDLGAGGWAIFAIILFWQLPHILSMAWMNRQDYIDVDYPLAPIFEGSGVRAARQMVTTCALLLAASVIPFALGMAGWIYLVPTVALGVWFLVKGIRFALERTLPNARSAFLFSLLYLPLVMLALAVGKL